jgi:hypothetical protein
MNVNEFTRCCLRMLKQRQQVTALHMVLTAVGRDLTAVGPGPTAAGIFPTGVSLRETSDSLFPTNVGVFPAIRSISQPFRDLSPTCDSRSLSPDESVLQAYHRFCAYSLMTQLSSADINTV